MVGQRLSKAFLGYCSFFSFDRLSTSHTENFRYNKKERFAARTHHFCYKFKNLNLRLKIMFLPYVQILKLTREKNWEYKISANKT